MERRKESSIRGDRKREKTKLNTNGEGGRERSFLTEGIAREGGARGGSNRIKIGKMGGKGCSNKAEKRGGKYGKSGSSGGGGVAAERIC